MCNAEHANDEGPDVDIRQFWFVAAGVVLLLNVGLPLTNQSEWDFLGAFYVVFFYSQITAHATWVVLGPGLFWLRLSSISLAMAVAWWYMQPIDPELRSAFQLALLVYWLMLGGVFLFVRGIGFRLGCQTAANPAKELAAHQFSLSRLVGVMTVVCIVAAVAARLDSVGDIRSILVAAVITNALLMPLMVPPILAVLIFKEPWAPAMGCLAVSLMMAVILNVFVEPALPAPIILAFLGSFTLIQLAVWGLVRRTGYRLQRVAKFAATVDPDAPAAPQAASEPLRPTGPVQSES